MNPRGRPARRLAVRSCAVGVAATATAVPAQYPAAGAVAGRTEATAKSVATAPAFCPGSETRAPVTVTSVLNRYESRDNGQKPELSPTWG